MGRKETSMSHRAAGGPKSKNIVEPRVRTGTGSHSARPAGVSQIGTSWGNHVTTRGGSSTDYRGERLHNEPSFQPVKFRNQVPPNVAQTASAPPHTLPTPASQSH